MTRLKRLETVQGVLGDRAEASARQLEQARRRVTEAEDRLTQLQQFREDYRRDVAGEGQGLIDAFRLRDFNAFISRLDAAIAQQHRHLMDLRQQADGLQEHWLTERRRADAVEKVVDKQRAAVRRDEASAEQRASDELALRMRRFRTF